MFNFGDLKSEIGRKVFDTTAASAAKIGVYLNLKYEDIWNKHFWKRSIVVDAPVTTTANNATVILPLEIASVLCITDKANDIVLENANAYMFNYRNLGALSSTGTSYYYADGGYSPVATQLSGASTVTVESSSALDANSIYITGKNSLGIIISETVSLSGTTAQTSANTYTEILSWSKNSSSIGYITLKTGSTVLDYLSPNDQNNRYEKIVLKYIPDSARTLYVTGKRRFKPLVNDLDTTLIPIDSALFHYGSAMALRMQGKYAAGDIEEREGDLSLNSVIGSEGDADSFIQTAPHRVYTEEEKVLNGANI